MIFRAAKRSTELNFCKAEAIPELISRASQPLELLAPLGIKKAHLVYAMGKPSEFDSDQTHWPLFPMPLKETPQGGEEHGVEMSRLRERLGARDGLKSRVPNPERDRSSVEARIAQAFRTFLA